MSIPRLDSVAFQCEDCFSWRLVEKSEASKVEALAKDHFKCAQSGVTCQVPPLVSESAIDFLQLRALLPRFAEVWVSCGRCHKWRWVPEKLEEGESWECKDLPGLQCSVPQALSDEQIDVLLGIEDPAQELKEPDVHTLVDTYVRLFMPEGSTPSDIRGYKQVVSEQLEGLKEQSEKIAWLQGQIEPLLKDRAPLQAPRRIPSPALPTSSVKSLEPLPDWVKHLKGLAQEEYDQKQVGKGLKFKQLWETYIRLKVSDSEGSSGEDEISDALKERLKNRNCDEKIEWLEKEIEKIVRAREHPLRRIRYRAGDPINRGGAPVSLSVPRGW